MKREVIVLGEVCQDLYYHLDPNSYKNPEGDLTYKVKETETKLGMANNVAKNLRNARIRTGLITDCIYPKIKKIRLVEGDLVKMRVDLDAYLGDYTVEYVCQKIESYKEEVDYFVLSDYGKAFFKEEQLLATIRDSGVPFIVDPHIDATLERYKGCFMIVPNLKEAETLTECEVKSPGAMIQEIHDKTGAQLIVIKMGAKGMIGKDFRKNETYMTPAKVKDGVVDVCGAGDTVTAYLTRGLIDELTLAECMELASEAASKTVKQKGVYQPELNELDLSESLVRKMEEAVRVQADAQTE